MTFFHIVVKSVWTSSALSSDAYDIKHLPICHKYEDPNSSFIWYSKLFSTSFRVRIIYCKEFICRYIKLSPQQILGYWYSIFPLVSCLYLIILFGGESKRISLETLFQNKNILERSRKYSINILVRILYEEYNQSFICY